MIAGMTIPSPVDGPLLLTDTDVLQRVRQLVGPALKDRTLWLMLVDGDDRQSPVVMPIEEMPREPAELPDGLIAVLREIREDLVTDQGSGSVILTLERLGSDAVLPADRAWADTLAVACKQAGTRLRGVFLSTRGGVRRLL